MRTLATLTAALLMGCTAAQAAEIPSTPKLKIADLDNFRPRDNTFSVELVDLPVEKMRELGHFAATIQAAKAPVNEPLLLISKSISETVISKEWIGFDEEGYAYNWADNKPLALSFTGYTPGQTGLYYVMDASGRTLATTSYTPFPVQVSEGDYKLTWNVGSIPLQVFIVTVEGFEPGEDVVFFAKSNGKIVKLMGKATESGRIVTAVGPSDVDIEKGGWQSLQFDGKKGKIGIRYPWGRQFENWSKQQVARAENHYLGSK